MLRVKGGTRQFQGRRGPALARKAFLCTIRRAGSGEAAIATAQVRKLALSLVQGFFLRRAAELTALTGLATVCLPLQTIPTACIGNGERPQVFCISGIALVRVFPVQVRVLGRGVQR